jgi:branched-chain amino acid transport system substrate-binding protein
MKKTVVILVAIVLISTLISVLGIVAWPHITHLFGKEVVYIAVVGPMSGVNRQDGDTMLKGIRLYLDKANKEGYLHGKTIKLVVFNDQNTDRTATKVASDIAADNKILLVLGHYSSDPTLAGGEIYKKNGIPAITASATADDVTRDNEWYFRIIPNSSFQADFIANYVKNVLQQESGSLIVDKDRYGSSLAERYEITARELGIKLNNKWEFDSQSPTLENQLKTIITELRATEEPGAIFFATHAIEAVKIITSIKFPGVAYTLIGPDSFATGTFIKEFEQYPQERVEPGYSSDGVYAVSPFIADIATEHAQTFKREFIKKYQEEPTWEAACYYDAAYLAIEAIERAEIEGEGHLRSDRRKIRDALASLDNPDMALAGVTGNIYFDQNRNVNRPFAVGIYEKRHFRPAFVQYQLLVDLSQQGTVFKPTLGAKIIRVNDQVLTKTQVVYTGIDINETSNFDIKKSSYTLDFYLWFRFQEDFNDRDLIFLNAVSPITLGTPIVKQTKDNYTVRTYHVKADFKTELDFHDYPFESPILRVMFRHAIRPINSLLYVPDIVGLRQSVRTKNFGKTIMNSIPGWGIEGIVMELGSSGSESTIEHPVSLDKRVTAYSQFNANIRIRRNNMGFIMKVFFPILIMAVMLYWVYYIPPDRLEARVLLFMVILLASVGDHLKLFLSLKVKYITAIDYAFFTLYTLVAIVAFISVGSYLLHKRGARRAILFLMLTGRILHPVLVGLVSFLFLSRYVLIRFSLW